VRCKSRFDFWGERLTGESDGLTANTLLLIKAGKIPRYNAINTSHGYHAIGIFSPQEVIDYEDQSI